MVDNDAYYDIAVRDSLGPRAHDVRLSGGLRRLWFLGGVDLGVEAAYTRELNRYFVEINDASNLNLSVSIRRRRSPVGAN